MNSWGPQPVKPAAEEALARFVSAEEKQCSVDCMQFLESWGRQTDLLQGKLSKLCRLEEINLVDSILCAFGEGC